MKSSLYLRGKIAVTGDFVTSIMNGYLISDDVVVPTDELELVTADFRVADIDSVAAIFCCCWLVDWLVGWLQWYNYGVLLNMCE